MKNKKHKSTFLKWRKEQLYHCAGYDIIHLLEINKLVSVIEDERCIVVGNYGQSIKNLQKRLED